MWGSTGVGDKGVDGDEDAVANAVWRELRGRVHCADSPDAKETIRESPVRYVRAEAPTR